MGKKRDERVRTDCTTETKDIGLSVPQERSTGMGQVFGGTRRIDWTDDQRRDEREDKPRERG